MHTSHAKAMHYAICNMQYTYNYIWNIIGILKSPCIMSESTVPTLEELLDPAEEREIGEGPAFEGGDKAIADEVRHEIAVARSEIIEIDSDDDDSAAAPITDTSSPFAPATRSWMHAIW
ncbi:hypothetical protein BDR04DRAFT_1123830 [Suillus decipiens]|nr:hypothetical protein BDR04DRAFT_1123830 [Suillus decipiens]